jgi:hypothetical protein
MASFTLALDRLKKLNAFVLADTELADVLVFGEYNFLQSYQLPILLDLVAFFDGQASGASLKEERVGAMVRVRQSAAVAISLFSYALLVLTRRRVLVYGSDKETNLTFHCDFRLVNLMRYLIKERVGFVEILHTTFKSGLSGRALRRSRLAMYMECADIAYKVAKRLWPRHYKSPKVTIKNEILGLEKGEAEVFRTLLQVYTERTNRSLFRIRFFARLFRLTNLKVLLAPADPRNYNELVAACKRSGITTYGFQSGNISKHDVGLLYCGGPKESIIKPDVFFTETGYWRDELIRLGSFFSSDEIRVGGSIKEEYQTQAIERRPTKDAVTILIPYEIAAPKEEVLAFIQKMLVYPELKVVFKFRADRDLEEQASQYGLNDMKGNIELVTNFNEIESFDVVAGSYSTLLYEMVGKGVPVAYLKTSLDYGEGLLVNGLAEPVSLDDADMLATFTSIKNTSKDVLESRRKKLYGDTALLAETLDGVLKVRA